LFSINIFIKNKKSKLCFGDRDAVLNVSIYGMEGVQIKLVQIFNSQSRFLHVSNN
jgi:hypothetical protein